MFGSEKLTEKWSPVLDAEAAAPIKDNYRKAVTAALLENTEQALREQAAHQSFGLNETTNVSADMPASGTSVAGFDPVLISLVRRAMPNLIAYDIAGVQPMSGPTGLIFAMKSQYVQQGGTGSAGARSEALFDEANVTHSGARPTPAVNDTQMGNSSSFESDLSDTDSNDSLDIDSAFITGGGLSTNAGETSASFAEMAFSIDRTSVTAETRQLKAEYTMELAQDLKAVHGLDAETELANILSAEILAEINREVVRTVNDSAQLAAKGPGGKAGLFDLSADSDGRWSVEKYKSLIMKIELEANSIAKTTRRGKGNFVICSSDVASALAAAGLLDYTPALSANLNVDDTGNTFAGVLNGRMKVYIDPYAAVNYVTVGYRGSNPYDAGLFYCPYVPLTMVKAVGENTFQPKIGFKTRYGMTANPFTSISRGQNTYFRKFGVANILSAAG